MNIHLQSSRKIIREIYEIALPLCLSTMTAITVDLICLFILGSINATSYYISSLFMPISFLLFAIFECYRTPIIFYASTTKDQQQIGDLGNHLLIIGCLALVTILIGLGIFSVTSKPILKALAIQAPVDNLFIKFSLLMIGFGILRSWSACLVGAMYGIGKHKIASRFSIVMGIIVCSITFYFAHGSNQPIIIYSYIIACCSLVSILVTALILRQRGCFKNLDRTFIQNKLWLIIKGTYRIGSPIFFSYLVIFVSLFFFNLLLAPFGSAVVAGFGVGYQIQSLITLPAISIGIGSGILINRLITQHSPTHALQILQLAIATTFIVYLGIALLVFLFKGQIAHLIVTENSIATWCQTYLANVAPSYFAFGPNLACLVILEQIGMGFKSLVFNLIYFSMIIIIGGIAAEHFNQAIMMFKVMRLLNFGFFALVVWYSLFRVRFYSFKFN